MSKTFIALLITLFVLVGAAFFLVLRWGSQLPTQAPSTAPAYVPPAPPPPPPPSVNVTEQKSKSGNLILIQWSNLPDGTTELEIFKSLKGKNNWTLWKTVTITGSQLGSGSATFNIGKSDYSNYDFYTEAVGAGGNGGTSLGTSTLWTSDPVPPIVTTSTPPSNSGNDNNPPPENPTSTAPATTTPTSTGQSNDNNGNSTSTNNPPPVPTGTPYYNPQVQISSYGQAPGTNFWVQHLDQTIQLGWQNIPPITTSIVISRSASQTGPFSELLIQKNPPASGSYSIQVVDETVNLPYYYEMEADAGTTTVATYGPIYLPPAGQ